MVSVAGMTRSISGWGMESAKMLAQRIEREIESLGEASEKRVKEVVEHIAIPPAEPSTYPFNGYVESVRVQGIRSFGAEQELELSRGLTILYAENGTGKTSIIDAVELLTKGVTTRASQPAGPAGEVKDENNVPYSDVDGKLTDIEPNVSISWIQDGKPGRAVWNGAWGQAAADAPPVQLIARRRLREVINLSGADRADLLGHAAGLGDLAQVWGDAQKALDQRGKELSSVEALPSAAMQDAVTWAEGVHDCTSAVPVEEIAKLVERNAQQAIARCAPDSRGPGERLSEAWEAPLPRPPEVLPAAGLEDLVQRLTDQESREVPRLSEALDQATLRLLESFAEVAIAGEACPACTVATVTSDRIAAVHRLLESVRDVREYQEADSALRKEARGFAQGFRPYLEWRFPEWDDAAVRSFAGEDRNFSAAYGEARSSKTAWDQQCTVLWDRIETAGREPSADSMRSVVEALRRLVDLREVADRNARAAEHLRSELLRDRKDAELAKATWRRDNARAIAEAIDARRKRDVDARNLRIAAQRLKARRAEVLEAKLTALAEPISSWLRRLAPDHTPSVRLQVSPGAQKPRLNVLVGQGKQTAIGRLSDSQLDMLGLAVHLATLEQEQSGAPVIIDDPTDMLDAATVEKLAGEGIGDLLGPPNGPGRQVVVLTHDEQLVRSLWKHHGARWPLTTQWFTELDREIEPTPQSLIKPRSPQEYADRLKALLQSNADAENRIWLRSAAGNLARQTLEAIIGDLFEVVGPRGLRYLPDLSNVREDREKRGVLKHFDLLDEQLRKIQKMHAGCTERCHANVAEFIDELLEMRAERGDYLLNEASHANCVYPRIAQVREYQKKLSKNANRFQHARRKSRVPGARPDDWPETSEWSRALAACSNCQVQQFFPHLS